MKIDVDVLRTLTLSTVQGTKLVLPADLDRKHYLAVNKVLEAMGAKWTKADKAHVFDGLAQDAVDRVVLAGEVTDKRRELGFFETPSPLAAELVKLAQVGPGMRCLEPSAGKGRIAEKLADVVGVDLVQCVEVDFDNVRSLTMGGFVTRPGDFLKMIVPTTDTMGLTGLGTFDRIVMNPPFARQADVDHVRHAISFLAPKGRLAAIVSSGATFRMDRKAVDFRQLVKKLKGSIEALPEESFRESGTSVRTAVVRVPA